MTPEQQDFINTLNFIAAVLTGFGAIALALFGLYVAGRKKVHEAMIDAENQKAEESKKRAMLTDLQIKREQDEHDKLTSAITDLASGFNSFSQATAQNSLNTDKLYTALTDNSAALKNVAEALSGYKSEFSTAVVRMQDGKKEINDNTNLRADDIKAVMVAAGGSIEAHIDARMDKMDENVERIIEEISKLPDVLKAMFAELQEAKAELERLRPLVGKVAALEKENLELRQLKDNQAEFINRNIVTPAIGEAKVEEKVGP